MSWIAVDLDKTLAYQDKFDDDHIGSPIAPMVNRIRAWRKDGLEVRIFTARVGLCGKANSCGYIVDEDFVTRQRSLIEAWCLEHIGEILPVTASKDFEMVALFDDLAREVIPNTGFLKNELNR